jgi:hypothetical protein
VRRGVDRLKVTIESNGRVDHAERINMASALESMFKRLRALVEGA